MYASDVYIFTKGKKNTNAEKNEDIELTHTQALCGSLLTVNKNKLYWCH